MAESEDMEDKGLDSAVGRPSWLDSRSSWLDSLWLVGNVELLRNNL